MNRRATKLRLLAGHLRRKGKPNERKMAAKLLAMARRDADPDETPEGLAAAVDAVLDQALEAISAGEVEQGLALLTAAAASIDELLDALGVTDADEVAQDAYSAYEINTFRSTLAGVERRSILQPIELEEREGQMPLLKGHSAVFNSRSEDLGFFIEVIRPGAFADVIGAPDIVCLANHNVDRLIASVRSGSLQLVEDKRGLYMEADPNDTTTCRDVVAEVRRRDMNGQSFSFDVLDDNWRAENGVQLREILKLKRLYDVGPVVFPAYPATDVSARNLMAKAGLDLEGFAGAFVKTFRGLQLSAADRDMVKRAIEVLQVAISDARQVPGTEGRSDGAPEAWHYDLLRRRLAIASVSG